MMPLSAKHCNKIQREQRGGHALRRSTSSKAEEQQKWESPVAGQKRVTGEKKIGKQKNESQRLSVHRLPKKA
jgi:hypothetical protein